jgi:S1-C subfamily serine protease
VNTAIYSPTGTSAGIGFAVPVDTVNRIIPQLLATGKVSRPYMGAALSDAVSTQVSGPRGVKGIVVAGVEPDSPAAKAGLRGLQDAGDGRIALGDIIQQADGKPVQRVDDLFAALERRKAGETMKLQVLRDGSPVEITVTLAPAQQ